MNIKRIDVLCKPRTLRDKWFTHLPLAGADWAGFDALYGLARGP